MPLTLRMEFLMTSLANTDKLPLASVLVPNAESQIWPVSQVLHMMHNARTMETPSLFA